MKKNILLVYTNFSTFVKTDHKILSERYHVEKYQYKPVKGLYRNLLEFLKQFFFLLFHIRKFDAAYIWFADYHSFLPVLFSMVFKKKSFVVIGGYDVARIQHLAYGVFTSKLRGFFSLYSMNHSSVNLTVSKYVDRKVNWIAPKANTELIYNCVSLDKNAAKEIIKKENLIVTVGLIEKEQTFYIKGIDTFIEVARLLPQYKFLIIGLNSGKLLHLLNNLPDNLTIKEKIPHPELVAYYQKAKIYCQLSRSESFGLSIVEAMSMGCIPIVINTGGMPEATCGRGFVVFRNSDHITFTIKKIMSNRKIDYDSINTVIENKFSVNSRADQILEIIGKA